MLSIIEKVLALEGQEIFSGLTSDQLSHIAEQMGEVFFKKGESLFRKGEAAEAVYFIFKGKVHLLREEEIISEMGPGSPPVGGIAVFTESNFYLSAEAAEDCQTMQLLRDDLLSIMYDYPDIPINILKITTQILMDLAQGRVETPSHPLLTCIGLKVLPNSRPQEGERQ